MPGCAAVGCNNRSEKGYIMKCFPRDPKLRKVWQDRVARADWVPSNNSFLCHVHFEADEWCIADNGRVRLKKDAIPSIFNVTSTRKSHKKRTKLKSVKNGNEYGDYYAAMYLENDTECSSTCHLEEKDSQDSDSQDIDDLSIQPLTCQQINHSPETIKTKQVSCRQYKVVPNEQDSIILISDDDMETQDIIKECDVGKQADMKDKGSDLISKENSAGKPSEGIVIKTEIKREIDLSSFDDSYDEIEEKLKQICDSLSEEDTSNNTPKLNLFSRNQKETPKKLHKSINYKYSSKNTHEIGNMLTNNTDNVEIIFGTESGEECTLAPTCTSYNNNVTNEIDNLNQCATDTSINNKEIDKTSLRSIKEAFNKENVHVTPNMKAAMKRKRRTREEIMKSIEKSICNVSSRDTNSISNSDMSDDIAEIENILGKELNTPENTHFNNFVKTAPITTRFTIKVTGDPDDVFDITQNLLKDARDTNIQEYSNTDSENNAFVTSVITIDDGPMKMDVKSEYNDNDILSRNIKNIMSRDNNQMLLSASENNEHHSTRLMSYADEESNNLGTNSGCLTPTINNVTQQTNCAVKYKHQQLQRKLKMQENVIVKLIDQLIACKSVEKDLRSKYSALEKKIENLTYDFDIKTSSASCSRKRENMDLKQKLLDDLSNRLSYFEEANKKLMKNVSLESQQRKKFEGQIKQRDNRIKELNWKLEKASKYLERAEKNTITYRRKMLNMQTFMRRKKLLDEKMNKFNEILVDSVMKGHSKKTLPMEMAMEIKKTCGTNGYKKLLSFGFPLPELSALQILSSNNLSDSNESTNEILHTVPLKYNANDEYNIQCTKNDVEMDTKDSGIAESLDKEIALDDTETITGTVQDIFEENNDGDDFSANELTEDFISQLQTAM